MSKLTQEQNAVVKELVIPTCVIAIPGSGKTNVLTHKIVAIHRLDQTVVASSFTREAASELKARAQSLIGKSMDGRVTVGTFHSLVIKALRDAPNSPLHQCRIASGGEAVQFMKMALQLEGIEPNKNTISWFDTCRSKLSDPYGMETASSLPVHDQSRNQALTEARAKQDAVLRYESLMATNRLIDFQGLMKAALAHVRAGRLIFNADHLLIDEAQDIDELQLQLIVDHAALGIRVDLVGDDDQSVYAFRQGLGFEGLARFTQEVGAKQLTLNLNFRCKQEILKWAGLVIEQNQKRLPKQLVAARGPGGNVRLMRWENGDQELWAVAQQVQDAVQKGCTSIALIARNNNILVEVQAPLSGKVAFNRINCDSFWETEPACVVLAFLRCMATPDSEIAGYEELLFWCGVSANTLDRLRTEAARTDQSIAEFALAYDEEISSLDDQVQSAATILRQFLLDCRYPNPLRNDKDVDRAINSTFSWFYELANISNKRSEEQAQAQTNILKAAERVLTSLKGSLAERIRVIAMNDRQDGQASVTLVSMHSSKGREFDAVFVIGAEDDRIPGRNCTDVELEEERRLLYVAMTRARDSLTISYARSYHSPRGTRRADICRFLFVAGGVEEEDMMANRFK